MTRAEKFKEVFGLKMDAENADCGFFDCSSIESCASCPVLYTEFWWNSEYEAPSQPQDGDRAVSLNAVLEAIDIWDSYTKTIERIKNLPSVQPKIGRWIEHEKVYECSECHIVRAKGTTGKYNYCPSCGSRMRKDGDTE